MKKQIINKFRIQKKHVFWTGYTTPTGKIGNKHCNMWQATDLRAGENKYVRSFETKKECVDFCLNYK